MAQGTTPDALDQGACTIGFFSLPRELRDSIYDMVWQEKQEKISGANFRIQAAIPKVRLISRHFKSEYDERSPANSILHIADLGGDFTLVGGMVPRLAARTTHVRLSLEVSSCDCADPSNIDESCTVIWAKDSLGSYTALLGSFHELRTTTMTLSAEPDDCLKRILEEAIKFPMLINLNIVSYDMMRLGSTLLFAI